LRLLTGKIITIQEEERKRLAADIHDTLAQTLTGISYKIQFCKELVKKNPQVLVDQLDGLIRTVHQAIDQSKELISSLRPDLIDTMGLVPALKRHIENFEKETGIRVRTHLPKRVQTPSEVNICLFRVAQEALTNIYKHAETKTAEFQLQKRKDDLILIVTDAGKGFDQARGTAWMKDVTRLGLLSMKERLEALGGTLTIHAGVNHGCRVEARIPLRLA
jgi:two-component system sensor histidine kinase DegS